MNDDGFPAALVVARAEVGAVSVKVALDALTEIAAPLRVRLGVTRATLSLTTSGEEPWWATVTVPRTDGPDAGPEHEVSAWVGRLDLRQAIDAEAHLVPDATCSLTIVQDDVVRYGGFALAATKPLDPEPPPLVGSGSPIAMSTIAGGRCELPDGRIIEVPSTSQARFTARGIEAAEVVDGSVPYLVGRVGPPASLVLIARAQWAPPAA